MTDDQLGNINVYSPAIEMAEAIRKGVISSRELVDLHIRRIEEKNPDINAIVLKDFEAARQRADQADEMVRVAGRSDLKLGPFHGVPLTVKESIFTPTFKTTMGDPNFSVPGGATCRPFDLLTDFEEGGGAILLGKSNLCCQALDWECNNPIYGETSNPFDLSRSPGGSSGGGAAALAAGFTPLEFGTDLGGSIRIPSAMNGVVGHCATRWVVPNPNPIYSWPCIGGLASRALGQHLDKLLWMARAGPMARTVEDVIAMLELLGGEAAAKLPRPKNSFTLKGARIAIWKSDPMCPPGKEVTRALHVAIQALTKAGATVEELTPPVDLKETYQIYFRFLGPVTGPHMSEAQRANVKNGKARDSYPPEMRSPYWEMDVSGVDGVPKDNQEAYIKAAKAWDDFLKGNYDAVLSPVFPTEAWPKASHPTSALPNSETGARKFKVDDDENRCYGDAIFWAHLSVLLGLPSTSFPVCRTTEGLPVGLQAFGAKGTDFIVLRVVQLLVQELKTDEFEPPADFVV